MISLYTPLPPVRSGTAEYAALLLRDLAGRGVAREQLRIIAERHREDVARGQGDLWSYPTAMAGRSPRIASHETAIFFVANNDHHGYVHAALFDAVREPGSRVIVVLHEPCCAFQLNEMARHGRHGFSHHRLAALMDQQYGRRAARFVAAHASGRLGREFLFTTHALGHVLAKADEIWTHSLFAALKLSLEARMEPHRMPRFRLIAHPNYGYDMAEPSTVDAPSCPGGDALFHIGIFGWVDYPKRVLEALEALARFVSRLPDEDAARIRLDVVGALPPPTLYDPAARAETLGLKASVAFHGFVDDERFKALQRRCALMLNLRHPSCGETSGVSQHARESDIAVATSNYQAFREAPADYGIPAPPFGEIEGIATAMQSAFDAWRRGQPRTTPTAQPNPRRQDPAALIARLASDGQ